MTDTHLWLNPVILSWESFVGSWTVCSASPVRRAYEHLEHAEKLLGNATTDFDLVDVVTTLKRSVDHRLRLLNEKYRWKKLPIRGASKMGQLQFLEELGIARHRMVTRLIDFRNSIEHGDKPPPNQEHCADLLEVVWYFLRSTDHLGLRIVSTFGFDNDRTAESWGLSIDALHESDWRLEFRARLPREYIRTDPHNEWLQVKVMRASHASNYSLQASRFTNEEFHRQIQEAENPMFLNGEIDGQQDLVHNIFKLYFALV